MNPAPFIMLYAPPGMYSIATSFFYRLVLESLVQSSYLPPSGSNRDWDQLVHSQEPKLTGLNQYKPVIVQLVSVSLQLHNQFSVIYVYNILIF